MDLNKVLPLYDEGLAYVKRCRDLCTETPDLIAIDPYYGYIQLTKEAFLDLVKDPDSIESTKMVYSDGWNHEAVVNGICFCCLTEKEDLYGG